MFLIISLLLDALKTATEKQFPHLVTASTKNGAGGEMRENPSLVPHPSVPDTDVPHPGSLLEMAAALCCRRGTVF